MEFIVRFGSERNKGAYLHVTPSDEKVWLPEQKKARRFFSYEEAEEHVSAYRFQKCRVVKIRPNRRAMDYEKAGYESALNEINRVLDTLPVAGEGDFGDAFNLAVEKVRQAVNALRDK